jgi:hypothetical protein
LLLLMGSSIETKTEKVKRKCIRKERFVTMQIDETNVQEQDQAINARFSMRRGNPMKQHIPPHHTLYLGSAAIQVQDEAFQYGYQQGYQRFLQTHARQELDDTTIHNFIASNITNTMAPDQENAGYITGWLAALLRQQDKKQPV